MALGLTSMRGTFGARLFALMLATCCVLVRPSYADNQADIITEAKAIIVKLKKENKATAGLRKQLEEIEVQVRVLLQSDPTTIQADLAAAKDLIDKNQGDEKIAESVDALRASVFDYQLRGRDAFIAMLADTLKTAVEEKGAKAHTRLTRGKILALKDVLSEAAGENATQSITLRMVELEALIKVAADIQSGDVMIPELGTLLTQLLAIEDNTYVAALRRRVASLDGMLTPPEQVRASLRLSDFAVLAQLRNKLQAVVVEDRTKIQGMFVVSARYGRVAGPKSGGGNCNARAAVVKLCQGQPKCAIEDAKLANLCGGEDPAPFALSRNKGLLVRYICLHQPKAAWNAILRANPNQYAGLAQSMILRNVDDEIVCALP